MADANTTQTNAAPVTGVGATSNASPVTVTETKPDAAKQMAAEESNDGSGSGGVEFWSVFWPALIVAVFLILWRTGKVEAIKKYINETRDQLRKATWPTRDELKQHIVVVLLSSALLAAFTVAADFVVREIIRGALLNGDTVLFDTTK